MLARLIGYGAVFSVGMISSPAWALDTGQCMPAAQVRQALADEGQNALIVGNRTGYGYPTALIFFANADGSKGYAVRSNQPLGQQGETACIESVYRDVRLNDITQPGIPSWAVLAVDHAKASSLCGRGGLGYQDICAPYDISRKNMEANGAHVMLMAIGTTINPRDKAVRSSQRIVVTVEPNEKLGLVDAVTPEGASYRLSAYSAVSYTQNSEALLPR